MSAREAILDALRRAREQREAVEHPGLDFCVGVQWHPEILDIAPFRGLIDWLKRA